VLRIPLPAVEVGIDQALPEPGATTQKMKVINQQPALNSLSLTLSAAADSHQTIMLRMNDLRAKLHVEGAQMPAPGSSSLRALQVDFGPGHGYVEKTVKFTW
jgi:hypothetical protein